MLSGISILIPGLTSLREKPRLISILIFLGAFAIYNLNLRSVPAGDTVPASLMPFSIVLDGSVKLDRFDKWLSEFAPGGSHVFVVRNGHVYSRYPVALPLLISPFYLPARWLPEALRSDQRALAETAIHLEKIPASLVAALAVTVFYSLVRKLVSPRRALLLTIVFALGTETWSNSSQALWQHGASELMIAAALLFVAKEPNPWNLAAAGFCAGLAAAVRPTNLIFVAAILVGGLLCVREKRHLAPLLAASVPPVLLTAYYNLSVFGDLRGGYSTDPVNGFGLQSLAGILVSPSRGLFVFCPEFLFALLGVYVWFRRGARQHRFALAASVLFCMGQVIAVSAWSSWWGGFSYGPRLLTDISPALTLLLIPALDWISRSPAARIAFAVCLAVAMAIQGVGAWFYPRGDWNATPVPVNASRLWDWRDSEILRTVRAGPDLAPYKRLISRLARTNPPR